MVDIVTQPAPPVPVPALASPPAITKLDVQKLAQAAALVAPLIPKAWYASLIIGAQVLSIITALFGAFTPLLPLQDALAISTVLSSLTLVFRYVNPNPPIAGGPQDLTTGVK